MSISIAKTKATEHSILWSAKRGDFYIDGIPMSEYSFQRYCLFKWGVSLEDMLKVIKDEGRITLDIPES